MKIELKEGMQVKGIYSPSLRGVITSINGMYATIKGVYHEVFLSSLEPVVLHLKSTERKRKEFMHKFISDGKLPDVTKHGSDLTGEELDRVAEFIGGFDSNIPYGDEYLERQWYYIRRYGAMNYRRQSYENWLDKNPAIKSAIYQQQQKTQPKSLINKLSDFELYMLGATITHS